MARAAKEEAEAHKDLQRNALKAAVMEAQEDGFPIDVEEKEAYFMNEVARGEQLAQEGTFSQAHKGGRSDGEESEGQCDDSDQELTTYQEPTMSRPLFASIRR